MGFGRWFWKLYFTRDVPEANCVPQGWSTLPNLLPSLLPKLPNLMPNPPPQSPSSPT